MAGSGGVGLLEGLENTDARVAANKPVTPTFLFAILFYAPVMARAARLQADGQPEGQALFNACEDAVRAQQSRVSIPRRFTLPMREMFVLQPRFRRREGKKAFRVARAASGRWGIADLDSEWEQAQLRAVHDLDTIRKNVDLYKRVSAPQK